MILTELPGSVFHSFHSQRLCTVSGKARKARHFWTEAEVSLEQTLQGDLQCPLLILPSLCHAFSKCTRSAFILRKSICTLCVLCVCLGKHADIREGQPVHLLCLIPLRQSLTEPGARLAVSKTQQSVLFLLPQHWGHRCTCEHTLIWDLEIQAQVLVLMQEALLALSHLTICVSASQAFPCLLSGIKPVHGQKPSALQRLALGSLYLVVG